MVTKLTDLAEARKLAEKIKKKGGKDLKAISENLIDNVWAEKKPARPQEKVTVLGLEFAGTKVEDKLTSVRKELEKKKCAGFVVCTCYVAMALF